MAKDWRKTAIAATILTAVLGLLALVVVSSDRIAKIQGPSKLALAADGSVWVQSHGTLHRFSTSGERTQKIALADLGRGNVLSDILPLRDGTLLVAEAKPSAAYRCDPVALICRALKLAISTVPDTTAGVLTFAADEARERLYIADNANHRLFISDLNGTVLAVSENDAVFFPNELSLDSSGHLVVADTNHHRIVRFAVEGDRFGAPESMMYTSRNKLSRSGRVWPNDFVYMPGGESWVLNADNGMRNADLLVFDAAGNVLRQIDLGVDADPTQLLRLDDRVLVADPTRFRLDAFDSTGNSAGIWGDTAFQNELQALRLQRTQWKQARLTSQIGVVLLPLLGILLLWRLGERLPRIEPRINFDPDRKPAPVEGKVQWLSVSARFKRSARMVIIFVSLLCYGAVGFCGWLLFDNIGHWNALLHKRGPWEQFLLGAVAVALLATPLLAIVLEPKAWRRRIGTDGALFFLDEGNGHITKHEFGDLLYDGQQLLVGKRMVKIAAPMGALFDKLDVQQYILPRLPKDAHVSGVTLFGQSLRRGNVEMLAALSIMVLVLIFSIAAPLLGWTSRHSSAEIPATHTITNPR